MPQVISYFQQTNTEKVVSGGKASYLQHSEDVLLLSQFLWGLISFFPKLNSG